MIKIFFIIFILLSVIIFGLNNQNENFIMPKVHYEWGLHENKHNLKKERKNIIIEKPDRDYSWHSWKEKKPKYDKIYRGKYKCYYEPGEDMKCKRSMRNCSIKSHPDFDKYILKSKIPPQPDMSQYILKSQLPGLPDMTNYIHKDELPDMSQFINKDKLKNYTRNDLIPPCEKCPPIPDCPTCPKCPEQKIIKKTKIHIKEHPDFNKYMLKSDCHKTSFGELIPKFLRKEANTLNEKIQERRNRFDIKC